MNELDFLSKLEELWYENCGEGVTCTFDEVATKVINKYMKKENFDDLTYYTNIFYIFDTYRDLVKNTYKIFKIKKHEETDMNYGDNAKLSLGCLYTGEGYGRKFRGFYLAFRTKRYVRLYRIDKVKNKWRYLCFSKHKIPII